MSAQNKTKAASKSANSAERSTQGYIYKILKSINSDTGASKDAMRSLDGTARTLLNIFSETARHLVASLNTRTITDRDVAGAVKLVLPAEMASRAQEEGVAAMDAFKNFENQDGKPVMRETRAGLFFSVSLVEKFMRQHGASALNVGAGAPIFLAAVIEMVMRDILDRAVLVAADDKKARITVRHLVLAVGQDEELNNLFERHSIVLLGGGVVPFMEQALQESRDKKRGRVRRKKKSAAADGSKRPHRFRPGTVAHRNAKAIQKTHKAQLQKLPFNKQVQEIAAQFKDNVRFSEDVREMFQDFIEDQVVSLFREANKFAIHANRETVTIGDYNLFVALHPTMGLSQAVEGADVDSHITDPGIQRLGRRGGVVRIAAPFYHCVKQFIKELMAYHLYNIITIVEHEKRLTVSVKSLQDGLAVSGYHLATVHRKIRRKAKKEDGAADAPAPKAKPAKSAKSGAKAKGAKAKKPRGRKTKASA